MTTIKKINLHFTDCCNYHCRQCFAKKENKALSINDLKKVVDNCALFFEENKIDNPYINLAGGEIFTYPKLQELIDYINYKNINCSIITNGYDMDDEFLNNNINKICAIGISIDSLIDTTNIRIGRCLTNGKLLSKEEYLSKCKSVLNKGFDLKINVCVSRLNYSEVDEFKKFFTNFKDDTLRIKIMRMIVVDNRNPHASKFQLTDDEFNHFCNELKEFNIEIENETLMYTKYLMINSDADVVVHEENGHDLIVGNVLNDFHALDLGLNKINEVKAKIN